MNKYESSNDNKNGVIYNLIEEFKIYS